MQPEQDPVKRQIDYRHPLPVRVWHWANAAVLAVLLMTGLLIFDIHPHLYWGDEGHAGVPAFLSLSGTHLDRDVANGIAGRESPLGCNRHTWQCHRRWIRRKVSARRRRARGLAVRRHARLAFRLRVDPRPQSAVIWTVSHRQRAADEGAASDPRRP